MRIASSFFRGAVFEVSKGLLGPVAYESAFVLIVPEADSTLIRINPPVDRRPGSRRSGR